jgi:hypothetical protein
MLKKMIFTAATAALLSACVGPPLQAGASREEVVQRFGTPTRIVPLESGTRLLYSFQPAGQSAMVADLDRAGRLVSTRQVLTSQNFDRIGQVAIGKWTRADVENELGRPALVDRVGSWNGDILNYRWLDGTQAMMFYVYLDGNSVVERVGRGMEMRLDALKF